MGTGDQVNAAATTAQAAGGWGTDCIFWGQKKGDEGGNVLGVRNQVPFKGGRLQYNRRKFK